MQLLGKGCTASTSLDYWERDEGEDWVLILSTAGGEWGSTWTLLPIVQAAKHHPTIHKLFQLPTMYSQYHT